MGKAVSGRGGARGRLPGSQGQAPAGAVCTVLAVLLAIVFVGSLLCGNYDMDAGRVVGVLASYAAWFAETLPARIASLFGGPAVAAYVGTQDAVVLLLIRVPRVVLAGIVGAALSAAGAAYQGMFKNPMVSPDILGVSSGASVGAAAALLLGLSSFWVHAFSFACGLLAVAIVMCVARAMGRGSNSIVVIILAGTVISALFNAMVSLCKYVADPDDSLPAITYWLMGSFSRSGAYADIAGLAAIFVVAGGALLAVRWRINALSFGEDEAKALGVDVRRTRGIVIAAATLLTASTVSYCGVVGWIGLIVPHMARLAVGPNYRGLLPTSMLGGAVFTMVADDIARVIVPGELPVGILTALVGAPLFVFMLMRGRKEWL